MFLLPDVARAFISASDLRQAAACEWALLAEFDVRLGRRDPVAATPDPVLERAAALGEAHEQAVLRDLLRATRGGVVQIPRPGPSAQAYAAADAATLAALRSPATVIYQGVFFDERFLGFADFLVRDDTGRWQVWDTKLARDASVPALLQIAAYADHLATRDVPLAPDAVLVLGSGDRAAYALTDIVPVYRSRRARLLTLLDEHQDEGSAAVWGDPRWHACGRCDACIAELQARDDVALVAGVYVTQRKKLHAAGVGTVAELATRTERVPELSETQLTKLREQARMQLDQERTGVVSAELHTPQALAQLPAPSPGDLFFDFEGDPLWSEPGSPTWGLEYLFGVIEAPVGGAAPVFRAFWAHDRHAERQALIDFMAYVGERWRAHPDMHIYHYADYERSRLLGLAARYGVCEAEVDSLLRAGVLVDLYAVVRSVVRVSQDSYSIKKLEPLYMASDVRVGDVVTGGDSIVVYHQFVQARIEGREDEAAELLETIRAYNEYDCRSTLGLRDWLLTQASAAEVAIGVRKSDPGAAEEPHPLETRLRELLGDIPIGRRTPDEQALAMVAASIQFNRREAKPFWWRHFDRLSKPVDEWVADTGVLHVESAEVDERGWFKGPRQRSFRRVLRATCGVGRGTRPVVVDDDFYALYDVPVPDGLADENSSLRAAKGSIKVTAILPTDDDTLLLELEEVLPGKVAPYDNLPLALVPKPGPGTTKIDAALAELGERVAASWPTLPAAPGLDLLRRLPPRVAGGSLPPVGAGTDRFVTAITAAVLGLDNSYLAVQGPPGTGKTYVGAHVIAALVGEHGWKIGVVAQSHAAVENVLDAVVRAGLDGALVGKQAERSADPAWTSIRRDELAGFAAERAASGYVIGGTAFDFTHEARVAREQLDLLVVDEAGQYSLANTLACSLAASRLLLLGDPQQLGEVSQGMHPEPINESALGWIIEGAPTLSPARGYFLSTTWRLHPALAAKVSDLSYAGSLSSQESVTAARSLTGVEPGLHVIPVVHRDNTTASVEEAEVIAGRVADLLGRVWTDPDERVGQADPGEGGQAGPGEGGHAGRGEAGTPDDGDGSRPLRPQDIRVVTPYNAQVHRLREALEARGLGEVPVGTVDKFQGQEGVVVFVSMAASARSDVPRGMGFLLDRNRLNVSISRGKWAAFVVCSDALTDFTPTSPRELLLLGAFLHLTRG